MRSTSSWLEEGLAGLYASELNCTYANCIQMCGSGTIGKPRPQPVCPSHRSWRGQPQQPMVGYLSPVLIHEQAKLTAKRVYRPGIYPKNMKLDSKTATFYESEPSEWLGGRKAVVPCAHILGGGSSINFMVSVLVTPSIENYPSMPGSTKNDTDVHPCLGLRLRRFSSQRLGHEVVDSFDA